MYAIVRSGSRQFKVAVGDVVAIDKIADEIGASIDLDPIMLVDGESVVFEASKLAKSKVTAEVLAQVKGEKIRILRFKNKSGKARRQGHRQKYTQVKITGIKA